MDDKEQKRAAKKFVEFWHGKGYEKGQTQSFWLSLLREVFGVAEPEKVISFEDQIVLKNTNFIDAYIPSTRVLIEQKGSHIDLTKKIKQSDGSMLTPYQQARRYISGLSYSTYPRWIVVCNFTEFHVHDMERPDAPPEIINLEDLPDECHRLRFLTRDQKELIAQEKELSVQAGELVGKIYDGLLQGYIDPTSAESQHSLNILCVRLVFCLYAEDAGIFGRKRMFHDYVATYKDRPRDVRRAILDLFEVFDTPVDKRDRYLDGELAAFPYVNGSLFADAKSLEIPNFSPEVISLLLNEASEGFDWSKISPTIFGAVFESTLNSAKRRKGGMHYTSIENIHKVIDPLFLDDLKDELAQIRIIKTLTTKTERLNAFHDKLASLTFLDPACGSGNFLTETYLSLRKLENEVIRIQSKGQAAFNLEGLTPTKISLNQFYGIEINDFACAVAKTALWIAESQMLNETEDILGRNLPFFPLKTLTNIIEDNALRRDWEEVIPKARLNYIIGNPPFRGHQWRDASQDADMALVFDGFDKYGKLDYVLSWFKKSIDFIEDRPIYCAFVATNSVVQGESVATFWEPFFDKFNAKINFAHTSFVWESEADDPAGVNCVIIGFSRKDSDKYIFTEGEKIKVANINGYLLDAPNVFIENRSSRHIDKFMPKMSKGSQPTDGGGLLLTKDEADAFKKKYPEAKAFVRQYMGAEELINKKERFCLWLENASPKLIRNNSFIKERLGVVVKARRKSPTPSVQKQAETPYLFTQIRQPDSNYLAVPEVSSERRRYIPIAYLDKEVIASSKLYLIPEASLFVFGILVSDIHMEWMRMVAGRLEMRYSYSPAVYMNFPFPLMEDNAKAKRDIEKTAQKILDVRAKYSECSLADLYDSEVMKKDLLEAHVKNNEAVRKAYKLSAKASVTEALGKIVELYLSRRLHNEQESTVDAAVHKVIGKTAETVPDWLQELRQQCLDGKLTPEELITQGKARLKEEKKKAKAAEKEDAKKAKETVAT